MNNFVQSALNSFMQSKNNQNLTSTEQNYINVLQSGNAAEGEALANNLLKSMGLSKEDAIAQARNFFHI